MNFSSVLDHAQALADVACHSHASTVHRHNLTVFKRFEALGRRDLRLASGLVLFTYLTVHLTNHALGLISLAVAEAGLRAAVAFWHSAAGTALLLGAAGVHVALALLAVYERCTLRMPAVQALRVVLGLWMPIVLITHYTGTRIAYERYGDSSDYARVVAALWTPEGGGRQLALLVPGWLHGCLGLRFAFGGRRWYRRAQPLLFAAALLLPVLAALGFLAMGRELVHTASMRPPGAAVDLVGDHDIALAQVRNQLLALYGAAVGVMLLARLARRAVQQQRHLLITITYPGRRVQVPRGWTVLEASRRFGIPHRSLCGGNARCSTCRVRVTDGAQNCPPPTPLEQQLLTRMRTGTDVRLACQLRPSGDLAVIPLAGGAIGIAPPGESAQPAAEYRVAVLIAQLRRSATSTSAHRSAHDRAYALGVFHEACGDAVTAHGGVTFGDAGRETIGLFGMHEPLASGCQHALQALLRIAGTVPALNARLALDLGIQVELTLAAHAGSVVVAPMGYRDGKSLTAVGPAVDATRHLLEWGKRQDGGCVISGDLLETAGVAAPSPLVEVVAAEPEDPPMRACTSAPGGAWMAELQRAVAGAPSTAPHRRS